jgi:hypothetical protein
MATATHLPAKLLKATGSLTSGQTINLGGDTFMLAAVKAGNGIPLTAFTNDTTTYTATWANGANSITVNSSAGLLPNMQLSGATGLPNPCFIASISANTVFICGALGAAASTSTAQASATAITVSSGVQWVSDVLGATTGTNAEDTLIGARQTLSSVTWAYASGDSVGTIDWSFGNVTYAQSGSDDGLTRYFVLYDSSVGAGDTTHPVLAILDPGQTVSVVNGTLTLQCPTGGLLQFTGAG